MPKNGTIAYVNTLPKCDFHGKEHDATHDFRSFDGRWGFGCEDAYEEHKMHTELGTGKGQKLEVRPDIVGPVIPSGS